jgi:hypothetical protein
MLMSATTSIVVPVWLLKHLPKSPISIRRELEAEEGEEEGQKGKLNYSS